MCNSVCRLSASTHRAGLVALILVAWSIAASTRAGAQTGAQVFEQSVVHEVRLFMHSRELALLRSHFDENTYYPADFQWGSVRVRNVAVRSRGFGSRNPVKLGLRIDFDRYTTGQRFAGLKALVLDNLWQDPSMVREVLAMEMFARMGQPASREAFCRLYINNEYQGLYALVEDIDDLFVTRTLGSGAGYLFEYHWLFPYYGESLGDSPAPYQRLFEARTHEQESDSALHGPIADLFRAVNGPDDLAWRTDVERHLDLAQFVTHVAIENFIAENDGLIGYAGMNNFYLHRESATAPHRLLVWDKDSAFLDAAMPALLRMDENVIMRRALADPELRALYLLTLEACAQAASADLWLESTLNRLAAVIDGAAREDTRKAFSNEAFDEAMAFLREFAAARPAFVLQEVERIGRER